jgi:uncharacterized membrane protein
MYKNLLTALLAVSFFGIVAWSPFGSKLTVKDGKASLPLSEVSDGQAHYFDFDAGGKKVKFFVVKSSDGTVRAAFDACDVCYPARKGYAQQGDYMVCKNCGMKFHSSRINVVSGGCNPSPLNRTVDGDRLVFAVSDLAAGARYF